MFLYIFAALDIKSSLYCALDILLFIFLLWIKSKILKDKSSKGFLILNVISNVLIFGLFLFGMALATGIKLINIQDSITNFFTESIDKFINSSILVLVCIILYNIISIFVKNAAAKKNKNPKRMTTISKIALSLTKYILYILGIIAFLAIWGYNIMPALAGLGLSALILGLGAQDLIKDFVAGAFIIFEHHFDVGDVVSINGFKGEVIDIGLKTTKIRNWMGNIKIVSNKDISDLINYSLTDTVFSTTVDISYDADIDSVIELLNKEMPLRLSNNPDLLVAPKVAGVSELAASGVRLTIVTTTISEKQYAISRELLKIIKQILDENNIEIPYNQIVVTSKKEK